MPTVHIVPARAARILTAMVAVLLLADLAGIYARFGLGYESREVIRLFDLSLKTNIPTWYASLALFVAALLLAFIAAAKRSVWESHVLHWGALAAIFLLLSLDKAVWLHEAASQPLQKLLGTSGPVYYGWLIAAGAIAFAILVPLLRFLRTLPREIAVRFVVASAFFVGGAVGLEMIGDYWEGVHGRATPTWALLSLAEELFEMTGVVVFIHALLLYIGRYLGEIRVNFAAPGEYRGHGLVRGARLPSSDSRAAPGRPAAPKSR